MGGSDADQDWTAEALRRDWGGAGSITFESGACAAHGKDGRGCTGAIPDQLIRVGVNFGMGPVVTAQAAGGAAGWTAVGGAGWTADVTVGRAWNRVMGAITGGTSRRVASGTAGGISAGASGAAHELHADLHRRAAS